MPSPTHWSREAHFPIKYIQPTGRHEGMNCDFCLCLRFFLPWGKVPQRAEIPPSGTKSPFALSLGLNMWEMRLVIRWVKSRHLPHTLEGLFFLLFKKVWEVFCKALGWPRPLNCGLIFGCGNPDREIQVFEKMNVVNSSSLHKFWNLKNIYLKIFK